MQRIATKSYRAIWLRSDPLQMMPRSRPKIDRKGDKAPKGEGAPLKSDYGSKDCVNLPSSTAVPRLNLGTFYTLLFRARQGNIVWKTLSEAEYKVLQCFEKQTNLDEVCTWLEDQSPSIRRAAEENLQNWFHNWTVLGIFHAEA